MLLIYINVLYCAIRHCLVQHFADGTNLLSSNNSVKKINKLVNPDLKNSTNVINANKIYPNINKTGVALFKSAIKGTDYIPLKQKTNGKRL